MDGLFFVLWLTFLCSGVTLSTVSFSGVKRTLLERNLSLRSGISGVSGVEATEVVIRIESEPVS